jgi:hypothetical protein
MNLRARPIAVVALLALGACHKAAKATPDGGVPECATRADCDAKGSSYVGIHPPGSTLTVAA